MYTLRGVKDKWKVKQENQSFKYGLQYLELKSTDSMQTMGYFLNKVSNQQ